MNLTDHQLTTEQQVRGSSRPYSYFAESLFTGNSSTIRRRTTGVISLTLHSGTSRLAFGCFLLTVLGFYHVGKTTASDACGCAWALTLMFSCTKHAFENWPHWRSDDNEEPVLICIAGVMMMVGAKGFELLS